MADIEIGSGRFYRIPITNADTRNLARIKTPLKQTRTKKPRSAERRNSRGRRMVDTNSWFENQPVLNTGEACKYLRISRPTFLKLIEEGNIRAQKIGRGWKVLRSELDRFLTNG